MATTTTFRYAALIAAATFVLGPTHAQEQLQVSVHFASASSELDEGALSALESLCERIGEQPLATVTITGHTDDRGSEAYNMDLSHRRAQAVHEALQEICPELAASDIKWNGEGSPIQDNTAENGRADNRRVDIEWSLEAATEVEPAIAGPHSLYDALIPGAAVQFENTTADAEQPIAWTTSSGVQVRMDANSLVDQEGRPVIGSVDLYYRSFDDPWKTVASGIPMHMRTDDGVQHMESAFMVELLAQQNGKPLQLRPGSEVAYDIPTDQPIAPDFATFTMDPATKQWDFGGSLNTADSSATTANITSVAMQRYAKRYWSSFGYPDRDTTHFAERDASPNYAGTKKYMPIGKPYSMHKGHVVSPYGSDVPAISLELLRGSYTYHGHVGFRIRPENSAARAPELIHLPKAMGWAYAGSLNRREFNKAFVRKHYYQDMRIEADSVANTAVIHLKDRGKWIDIPVVAELAEASMRTSGGLQARMRRYNTSLQARIARFDKQMDRRALQLRIKDKSARRAAYASASPIMSASESAMSTDLFHTEALRQHLLSTDQWKYQPDDNVMATLTSSGLGLCNIDRLIKSEKGTEMVARFQNNAEKPFRWTTAYAISNRRNAVITIWGNGSEQQLLEVAPGRMDWLVLATADGEVALVNGRYLKGSEKVLKVPYTPLAKDFTMADIRNARER